MRKTMYILMIVLFSCLVIAEPNFVFIEDNPATIKIPCLYNGSTCLGNVNCNISIGYPNGTYLVNNQETTLSGLDSLYNLSSAQTIVKGEHPGVLLCTDGDGLGNITAFSFLIVNSNVNFGNSDSVNYIYFLGIGLFSMVMLIIWLFKRNIVVGYVAGIGLLMVGTFMWFFGMNMPFTISTAGSSVINAYERLNPIISRGLGILITFFSIWFIYIASTKKNQEKKKKEIT